MLRIPRYAIVLAAVFTFCVSVQAQSPIPEDKRKLIAELVSVLKLESQMEKIADTMLKGMQSTFPITFNASLNSRTDLTEKEKEQIKAVAGERLESFTNKFRKRLPLVIDYPKYIQEAVFPLYDKYYTEQELEDMIAFYSTPTGQKVIDKTPDLLAESQEAAVRFLLPRILPLLDEITKEEIDAVAPPRPSKRS